MVVVWALPYLFDDIFPLRVTFFFSSSFPVVSLFSLCFLQLSAIDLLLVFLFCPVFEKHGKKPRWRKHVKDITAHEGGDGFIDFHHFITISVSFSPQVLDDDSAHSRASCVSVPNDHTAHPHTPISRYDPTAIKV